MDVWSWINNLPSPNNWPESDSQLVLQLASSKNNQDNTTKSILFIAERTYGSNTEALVTFSISLLGSLDLSNNTHKTLWVSDPCPISSQKHFLQLTLLLQLVRELITRSPTIDSRAPIPLNLDMKVVSLTLNSVDSDDSISHLFHLVLLSRLFLLCVCDSPTEFGSLYFQTLAPNLDESIFSSNRVMKSFLSSLGPDGELYFMRTIGYMLAKWLIFKDISGIQPLSTRAQNQHLVFSYAKESHGLLVLKGYAPVQAMTRTGTSQQQKDPVYGFLEAKESVLRYALGHQQLETVIQLEYSVSLHEGFIHVGARVDNIRLHVTRLGLTGEEAGAGAGEYAEETHFPSRVQVWVGPYGSGIVSSLSLGRSTENPEREVETTKVVKGSFGDSKFPTVKATARSGGRAKVRNWRWEQEAEGNTAVMDWVLCDNGSGAEVSKWGAQDNKIGFQKRYSGAWRAFSKKGGVVFAGDEYGEWVRWRVGKEMEGRVLKWKLGGKVWLSYWPNQFKTCYGETRCIEWCEDVDLPLIARQ
ncbi:uncharacterized protein LOC143858242 [Tasmannia lanceolata]|uniref:uncharacterized protein LOC143858242 n=1 Tax=Tasmannia lanceolata TaxID=3420 RepID=UPI004063589B